MLVKQKSVFPFLWVAKISRNRKIIQKGTVYKHSDVFNFAGKKEAH